MDYGKFKYEADQRAKESRKKSSNLTVKEMKLPLLQLILQDIYLNIMLKRV